MCGITGFWDLKNIYSSQDLKNIINKMKACLKSRGPDDSGIWIDNKQNLSLGHTRLSIIEPTSLGRQPMISSNNRFIIVYNGEIYNFFKLKKQLQKNNISFRSNSDTEALLEACSFWGIKKTLSLISGMFAFALWDRKKKELILARDRFGIKPLYYSLQNKLFLFSSQSKALIKHPKWKKKVNPNTLADYFKYGYIPSNKSIYQDTFQIPPGCYIRINLEGRIKEKCYWNLKENINENEDTSVEAIEKILESSIKKHMISDVPIGSFLSGGIDSSLVTALMQKNSISPVKTFSIGFDEEALDESKYAQLVAKHLNTDHHQVIFKHQDMIDLVRKINTVYDEPFADSSQLPTILLSQITRKKVKVALSGDGGDEFFGGYNRYNWAKKINLFYNFPLVIRKQFCSLIKIFSPSTWDKIFNFFPYLNKYAFLGDKAYKLANVLSQKSYSQVYPSLVSQWYSEELPLSTKNSFLEKSFIDKNLLSLDIVKQMQIRDIISYLPGDILTKVDRASMAYGLEVRVPFLDNELIKNIWFIKDRDKKKKILLKKILYKFVPKHLVDRPKMGFSVPLDKWLRGPLREWSENLLQEKKLKDSFLNSKLIRNKWHEHLSGRRNWQYSLWTVLIYQLWQEL